ncbi:hypothetical protein MRX96_016598 [Rhipicephalus microplus]
MSLVSRRGGRRAHARCFSKIVSLPQAEEKGVAAAVTLGEFQRCLSARDIVNKQRLARRQWCICFEGQPALLSSSRSSFEGSLIQRGYKLKKNAEA